jgi:RNA polymerase sigma-B factor
MLRRYRETGDRRLRNRVIEDHRWLAVVIAQDFRTGSEPLDDLIQVACIGLLKAAERFDPDLGVEYRTYGAVTARGELRRYYRDAAWSMRVPRRLQELRYEVRAATDVLQERLRRSPTVAEVAGYLHVDTDEIIDCLCADRNFRSVALDTGDADQGGRDPTGALDGEYGHVESRDAFDGVVALLPERLRRVVEMRFVEELKQAEIAAVLGVSQVHVSRLLRAALERLRLFVERRDLTVEVP